MMASFPLTFRFHDSVFLARKCRQDVELDVDRRGTIRILYKTDISMPPDRKVREQDRTHLHPVHVLLTRCLQVVTDCLATTAEQSVRVHLGH